MVATRSAQIKQEPTSDCTPETQRSAASSSRKRLSTAQAQRKAAEALAAHTKRVAVPAALPSSTRGDRTSVKEKGRARENATAVGSLLPTTTCGTVRQSAGVSAPSRHQGMPDGVAASQPLVDTAALSLQQISELMDEKLKRLVDVTIRPELRALQIVSGRIQTRLTDLHLDQVNLRALIGNIERALAAMRTGPSNSDIERSILDALPKLVEPLQRKVRKSNESMLAALATTQQDMQDRAGAFGEELHRRLSLLTSGMWVVEQTCERTNALALDDTARLEQICNMTRSTLRTVDSLKKHADAGPDMAVFGNIEKTMRDLRDGVAGVADTLTRGTRLNRVQEDLDGDDAMDQQLDRLVFKVRKEAALQLERRVRDEEYNGVSQSQIYSEMERFMLAEVKRRQAEAAQVERDALHPDERTRRRVREWVHTVG